MNWKKDFLNYFVVTQNLAPDTAKGYFYDAREYASFIFGEIPDDISNIEFSPLLIRDFAASFRMKGSQESTIERKIYGVLAFWLYCFEAGYVGKPLAFRDLGILVKRSLNPTDPLNRLEYKNFMEKIHVELQHL